MITYVKESCQIYLFTLIVLGSLIFYLLKLNCFFNLYIFPFKFEEIDESLSSLTSFITGKFK